MTLLDQLRVWAKGLRAQALTLWFCRAHPDTPLAAKLLAALVVAYAFSPIDLIPDFIPIIGYLDDLIIVPAGLSLALRLIPEHVKADGRRQAEAWLAEKRDKPRNRVAAVIIVLAWLGLAYWGWAIFAF